MSTDTLEIKEKEVEGWPGWTRVQMGTSRRYRSPGGVDISYARFLRLAGKYKDQGYIPENLILEDMKEHDPDYRKSPKGFMQLPGMGKPKKNPKVEIPNSEIPNAKFTDEPAAKELVDIIESEPRSRSRTGGKKHPRPTQAALSVGFKQLTLLLTAVVLANIMHDDRFAMSDQEATALAIAMANLLEPTEWNEKWGWIIADTGDWQMIGYILGGYIIRCYGALKERADAKQQNAGGVHQGTSTGAGSAQSNGQYSFVPNSATSPPGVAKPIGVR